MDKISQGIKILDDLGRNDWSIKVIHSGDGEKLFEYCGNTAESVFLELSEWCERIINE
jgi:hypothetical protein